MAFTPSTRRQLDGVARWVTRHSLRSGMAHPAHWLICAQVRFDPATEDKLESALQSGNAGVMTVPGKYHADIKAMMQKNVNTGFGRRIFRELA